MFQAYFAYKFNHAHYFSATIIPKLENLRELCLFKPVSMSQIDCCFDFKVCTLMTVTFCFPGQGAEACNGKDLAIFFDGAGHALLCIRSLRARDLYGSFGFCAC